MKTPLPILAYMFLLLLPLLGRAQETRISGHLIDAVTKDPIPFASLGLLKEDVGALSNEFGYFQFTGLRKHGQDSLIVMTLGYTRRAVFVGSGATQNVLVELIRKTGIIGCPVAKGVRKKGVRKPENAEAVIVGLPGTQFAFFMANEKQKPLGKLRAVSFYIGVNGFPMAAFRLHIYRADAKRHSPDTDLLNERVFITANKGTQWYTYDLSRYNIASPREGYFVALEFEEPSSSLPQSEMDDYTPSGQIMRPTFEYKESRTWSYTIGKGWNLLMLANGQGRRYNAMIKAEVEAVE